MNGPTQILIFAWAVCVLSGWRFIDADVVFTGSGIADMDVDDYGRFVPVQMVQQAVLKTA